MTEKLNIPYRTDHDVCLLDMYLLKRFNPEADLEYRVLPGTHTQGSAGKDVDGQYPATKISLDWLRRKGVI